MLTLLRPPHAPPAQPHRPVTIEEPALVEIKRELAIVRMLADELQRCVERSATPSPLRAQLAQELAQLGSQILEAAAAMEDGASRVEEPSGVHLVIAT